MSVDFKEGDDVKEGQVLFTLDRGPLEAALAQAEANLQRDIAQAANADAQAHRAAELPDTRHRDARAGRNRAGQCRRLATARWPPTAPRSTTPASSCSTRRSRRRSAGRTGALMVHAGNLVRANDTTPLVVINKLSPINVSFAIPESQLAALKRYMGRGAVSRRSRAARRRAGAL